MMGSSAKVQTWVLVVSALPPALAFLLKLAGPYLLHRVAALYPVGHPWRRETSDDLEYMGLALFGGFSVLVGCAVLLTNGVLIYKGAASLWQWKVLASVILAALDTLLPIAMLAIFLLTLRGLFKML